MKDEVLRLALEALGHFEKAGLATLKTIDAITAIKQALAQPEHSCIACEGNPKGKNNPCNVCGLAQPEPEPRVWIDHRVHAWPDCFVMQPDPPHTSPLYTSPPKREPLTDEEIRGLADKRLFYQPEGYEVSGIFNFARAIEAAHGIKVDA